MTSILMPIPDQFAMLTEQGESFRRQRDSALAQLTEAWLQRDAAIAQLAAKAGQHQTVSTQLEQASRALQTLSGEYQVVSAAMREATARLLAADQQHANEPVSPFRQCTQAPTLMDNLDPDEQDIMASFTADPVPIVVHPPTPTKGVMPATALRRDKQAIGLLW